MSDQHQTTGPDVYRRFIEELDAMTIHADEQAVAVVGLLTRAVKRAQMVFDGELASAATRKQRADDYVGEVMAGLKEATERKGDDDA
jgi:hypothetical protein